jgi:hypothetical protein
MLNVVCVNKTNAQNNNPHIVRLVQKQSNVPLFETKNDPRSPHIFIPIFCCLVVFVILHSLPQETLLHPLSTKSLLAILIPCLGLQ